MSVCASVGSLAGIKGGLPGLWAMDVDRVIASMLSCDLPRVLIIAYCLVLLNSSFVQSEAIKYMCKVSVEGFLSSSIGYKQVYAQMCVC